MDFQQLRDANQERNRLWDPNMKLDSTFFALGAAGEAGEVCNKVKKLLRQSLGLRGSLTDVYDVGLEIGDTIIYLDLLAKSLGLSTEECVKEAFNAKSKELDFPVYL